MQSKRNESAIVLVSGGMDSCVTAAIASEKYSLAFLHVNYGQRTEARELAAFKDIASFYNVGNTLITSISYLREIGGSSLTDNRIEVTPADIESKRIPVSYVPFRNSHLLSIAVSWGEVISASKIFIGAVEEDGSGYPDCREEYYKAFNNLVSVGTKPSTKIEVLTPLIHMKKNDIVLKGKELGAPFHLTWSCYRDNDIHCGECDSCAFRMRGFKMAEIEDPVRYKKKQ